MLQPRRGTRLACNRSAGEYVGPPTGGTLVAAADHVNIVIVDDQTSARTMLRHILPNIASTLIVSMTLTFPEIILLESGLSFLGLGVPPPPPEGGRLTAAGLRAAAPSRAARPECRLAKGWVEIVRSCQQTLRR